MSKTKGKLPQTDKEVKPGSNTPPRVPAQDLLLSFIRASKIVLVADEIATLSTDIKDQVYTVIKKPRIRVFYLDEINNPVPTTLNENGKTDVDIVK